MDDVGREKCKIAARSLWRQFASLGLDFEELEQEAALKLLTLEKAGKPVTTQALRNHLVDQLRRELGRDWREAKSVGRPRRTKSGSYGGEGTTEFGLAWDLIRSCLTGRDRMVIEWSFGFWLPTSMVGDGLIAIFCGHDRNGGRPISRSRVRGIRASALRKLRKNPKARRALNIILPDPEPRVRLPKECTNGRAQHAPTESWIPSNEYGVYVKIDRERAADPGWKERERSITDYSPENLYRLVCMTNGNQRAERLAP